jgi:hypothetical protein
MKTYTVEFVNGGYSVLNNAMEIIDTFNSEEYAEKVCNALNDGYSYSKEHGIE